MVRIMGQAGHKIILVNKGFDVMTVMTGFSKYVDKFYLIPSKEVYEHKLEEIWHKEKIDWFLPMNLSIDDIKFKIFMEFAAMQNSMDFSTISVNNIFMVKMLQNKPVFLKKCQDIGLPTIFDLYPVDTSNEVIFKQSENHGYPHAANVICKNGTPLLIQVKEIQLRRKDKCHLRAFEPSKSKPTIFRSHGIISG